MLPTLFQRCFANVETTSINVRRPNFHFQPNIYVDVLAGLIFIQGRAVLKYNSVYFYFLATVPNSNVELRSLK